MKKVYIIFKATLIVLIAAWAIGCDEGGPVELQDVWSSQSPQMFQSGSKPSGSSGSTSTTLGVVTASQTITPRDGGVVRLNNSYAAPLTHKFPQVSIALTLSFPPGAVSSRMNASVSIDQNVLLTNVYLNFSPSPVSFLKPAILDFEVYGVDLSGIPTGEIRIYYVNDENGLYELIPGQQTTVDRNNGYVKCVGAQLSHFSRYAFARPK